MLTFKSVEDYSDLSEAPHSHNIEFTLPSGVAWPDALSVFFSFLRAAGYIIDWEVSDEVVGIAGELNHVKFLGEPLVFPKDDGVTEALDEHSEYLDSVQESDVDRLRKRINNSDNYWD